MHAAHKAAAPTGDWLSTVYFQDSTHPSRFGQKLVAGVMAHRLTRQLVHRQPDPHPPDQTAAADDGAPPPAQRADSHRGKRKFLTQQAAPTFTLTMTLAPTPTLTLTLTLTLSLSLSLTLTVPTLNRRPTHP